MAASVVPHGRRKGTVRSQQQYEEIDPSQVAVIPSSEWRRMKEKHASWQNPAPTKAEQIQKQKQALYQHSKSVVKNWENTIEGQRLKRLQACQLREEEEENARIKIDEEEAKFQAKERKRAIEKAKTLLYYQTDRVRQLNGALVLSEVLREREAQLHHKKKRGDLEAVQETRLLKQQAQEREEAIQRDMEAMKERAKEKAALFQHHLKQKEENTQKKLHARLASLEEQKKLDQEAMEYHLQRKEEEDKLSHQKKEIREALDDCMLDKEKQAAAEKQQSAIDDEKMKIYTNTKKQMEKLRKQKEAENQKIFLEHQQLMRDNLQQHMEAKTSDEDQRIAEIVQQQLAKRDAEQREKQLKYIEANREIYYHTLEQIAEMEERKKRSEEMDREMLKQRIIQDQKFHAQQLEKQTKAEKDARELKQFQLSQIAEKQVREQETAEEDVAYNLRNINLLQIEEAQFQQYAGSVMKGATERKAPLQPLMTAAREGGGGGHGPMLSDSGVRPSYLAMEAYAVELPSYASTRASKKHVDTQKRLGFIW